MNFKELKKQAKKVVKSHYWLFLVTTLVAILIHSEFTMANSVLKAQNIPNIQNSNIIRNEIHVDNPGDEGLIDVIRDILEDNLEEGSALSNQLKEYYKENGNNKIFGRTQGVIASLVNALTSGAILVRMAYFINSFFHAPHIIIVLLSLCSMLGVIFIYYAIQRIYRVIARRIFLEGRMYEEVPLNQFLFPLRTRKWMQTTKTMFVVSITKVAWSLTIIGGPISYYSYFMIPFILAENPTIKTKEAMKLSRAMMKGHKWECFILQMSFIGWFLLNIVTFGISDILYGNSYRLATYTEYYVRVRNEAKEKRVPFALRLNDDYLYTYAPDVLLNEVYADIIDEEEIKIEANQNSILKFISTYFGLVIYDDAYEKAYHQTTQSSSLAMQNQAMKEKKAYPQRLSPYYLRETLHVLGHMHYNRHYSIVSCILLFFLFSFVGWLWEVMLSFGTYGTFINRGMFHGPWLPIYGSGGILILLILYRFRSQPVREFFLIFTLCGFIEYMTSLVMEIVCGARWWDYTGYFATLNGRICLEGLLVFGIGGMAFVYILAPLIDDWLRRFDPKKKQMIAFVLVILFAFDFVYSLYHPNMGEGICDNTQIVEEATD